MLFHKRLITSATCSWMRMQITEYPIYQGPLQI